MAFKDCAAQEYQQPEGFVFLFSVVRLLCSSQKGYFPIGGAFYYYFLLMFDVCVFVVRSFDARIMDKKYIYTYSIIHFLHGFSLLCFKVIPMALVNDLTISFMHPTLSGHPKWFLNPFHIRIF